MTKSDRLKPVKRVAESREQRAARAMADALKRTKERGDRYQELLDYRDEYTARFTQGNEFGAKQGTRTALQMQDFKVFLDRLDHIIREQEKLLTAAQKEYEEKRKHWLATKTKTQALDKAIGRFKQAEQVRSSQKEQKDQDNRPRREKPDVD